MHPIKKRNFITVMAILIGLIVQSGSVYAIYSPRLSQQVGIIKQHLEGSKAQNGSNTIIEEIEQIKAYDQAKTQAFEETGISGEARVAQEYIFNTTYDFLIQHPLDSIMMIFNFNGVNGEWISSCLRDDIWNLETVRDLVGAEMVKAYLLRDTFHGRLLQEDYKWLITHLDLLRKYGSDPTVQFQATDTSGKGVTVTSNKYFFGNDNAANYYLNVFDFTTDPTGCPEGEFQEAFREVANSAKTLAVLSSGQGVEWGDIWSMAKANARIRAREWIRANQISVTVGGEAGGRVQSLVKGGGWDRFVGNVGTQLRIAKNMVGPVTPWFDSSIYQPPPSTATANTGVGNEVCRFYYHEDELFRDCTENQIEQYEKCQDDEQTAIASGIRCERYRSAEEFISAGDKAQKQLALQADNAKTKKEVETAFIYSINLSSVAENNIYLMDEALWDMNQNIKRGYEAVDKEAGEGIPTLYREIATLAANQCPNK